MSNAYLDLAEEQLSAPVKAKIKGKEERQLMVLSLQEKAIRDQQKLSRQYIKWKTERLKALRNDREISKVLDLLDTLTVSSSNAFISYLQKSVWLQDLDRDTKADLLSAIADAIVRVREKEGLQPFDDALPGEPPRIFDRVKEIFGQ